MLDHLEWNQNEEKTKRELALDKLRQAEGWKNLTDRQRKIIELSLYIQQRAERGTDIGSFLAIESPTSYVTTDKRIKHKDDLSRYLEDGTVIPGGPREYRHSQDFIVDKNCFESVAMLENVVLNEDYPSFFKAKYKSYENIDGLTKDIEEIGYPAAVFVVFDEPKSSKPFGHAFVVMGHDLSGSLVVWQKRNPQYAYEVLSIDDVIDQNSNYKHMNYGIRSLTAKHNI